MRTAIIWRCKISAPSSAIPRQTFGTAPDPGGEPEGQDSLPRSPAPAAQGWRPVFLHSSLHTPICHQATAFVAKHDTILSPSATSSPAGLGQVLQSHGSRLVGAVGGGRGGVTRGSVTGTELQLRPASSARAATGRRRAFRAYHSPFREPHGLGRGGRGQACASDASPLLSARSYGPVTRSRFCIHAQVAAPLHHGESVEVLSTERT